MKTKLSIYLLIFTSLVFVGLYVNERSNRPDCAKVPCVIEMSPSLFDGPSWPPQLATSSESVYGQILSSSGYERIGNIYAKKDGRIFYLETSMRYTAFPVYKPMLDADANSFKIFESPYGEVGFAYDKLHVYFNNQTTDIDKNTIVFIQYGYIRDAKNVYGIIRNQQSDDSVKRLEYDVNTFRVFTGSGDEAYTLDLNGVYFSNKSIAGIDPNTFTTVSSPGEIETWKSRGKDPGSSLSGFYMRDKNYVVLNGNVLLKANAEKFRPIYTGPYHQEFGTDGTRVYYKSDEIFGADPRTFSPLSNQPYEGCGYGPYGKDGISVFYKNSRVAGADPNTFEVLYNGYAKDATRVYLIGTPLSKEEADPTTFTADCNYG
ncbi:MAG: DKNYY domain-containing protein [bacterium]|nr:DKNYY domain-containing protein [bacterium]